MRIARALFSTWAGAAALLAMPAAAADGQAVPAGTDADTRVWWETTVALSNDGMEGRDTGTAAYDRAADIVARRFAAAGLQPLGENGGWLQQVQLEDVRIARADIRVGGRKIAFLHEITLGAAAAQPRIEAGLVYRGYCAPDALGDVRGKLVICHPKGRPGAGLDEQGTAAIVAAGAAGLIAIADPAYVIEPPRWPYAYSRSVRLAGTPLVRPPFPTFVLNAAALGKMIRGSGQDGTALVRAGVAGDPLPSFDVPVRLTARFTIETRAYQSPNVIGLLPGTDPAKAGEAIVLTAHLDGYGHGTKVAGDGIYNGTLDDAAYVALLIRLAERRGGKGFRRPVIFAALAGEEKGLFGSTWLLSHPPVPKARLAGNINLDQLRPIFPLDLLTVHALDDTSLGDDARAVAQSLGIAVQNDPEPQRMLLQRSDHWNFLKAGIPATNFVFGYRPGSESERIYRRWYREGYHTPKDDPFQAIDWKAAADFNRFFYALAERVADKDAAPAWKPGSKLRPK
jgi:hypothetical protein